MSNHSGFRWLFLPLILLSLFAMVLFIERTGPSYDVSKPSLTFLDPIQVDDSLADNQKNIGACLVLYDSSWPAGRTVFQIVRDTLDSMRIRYEVKDIGKPHQIEFLDYTTLVIAFNNLDLIQNDLNDLTNWTGNGGRVLFAIRPDPSPSFSAIYRKLGIQSKNDELVTVQGIKFLDDLFPGTEGTSLGEELMAHSSLLVQLEDQCRVHLASADDYQLPILWEYNHGQGRFVVINSDQFINKYDRGLMGAAYSLLEDISVYPVINAAMFFIDDFPAPVPEGEHDLVTRQFGRDLRSFFVNIWWPDMQSFARKYGIKYTGVIIETYTDGVKPPFDVQENTELFNFFGTALLRMGGELGWHGYNHVPLCLPDSDCDHQLDYPYWPSEEAIQESLEELYNFSNTLFGNQPFTTYVPPSNILSSQTREWLADALPGLRVIASVYLPSQDQPAYVQEFEETSDGIIELPRIIAGFLLDDFDRWAAINEITLHYIYAQFVHPDDILDEERGEGLGWAELRDNLDDHLLWLYSSVPDIRNLTAREGAMAVQRYYRLGVDASLEDDSYHIALDHFHDEAFLLMRTSFTPQAIQGGELSEISDDLFLVKANDSDIFIQFNMIPVTGQPYEHQTIDLPGETPVSINISTTAPLIPTTETVALFRSRSQVMVSGTENRGLRLRASPGIDSPVLFFAREGDLFEVVEGPLAASDLSWWKIISVKDSKKTGWAAEDYLKHTE